MSAVSKVVIPASTKASKSSTADFPLVLSDALSPRCPPDSCQHPLTIRDMFRPGHTSARGMLSSTSPAACPLEETHPMMAPAAVPAPTRKGLLSSSAHTLDVRQREARTRALPDRTPAPGVPSPVLLTPTAMTDRPYRVLPCRSSAQSPKPVLANKLNFESIASWRAGRGDRPGTNTRRATKTKRPRAVAMACSETFRERR